MNALKSEVYLLAENELYQAAEEQKEIRRQQRRAQALIASGLLLSTLMSAAVGEAIGATRARPLTVSEANAISYLMDYVAYKMHAPRDWVEEVVMAEFDIQSLAQLQAKQYDNVVEYLLQLVH
jgi:hypothetical protein